MLTSMLALYPGAVLALLTSPAQGLKYHLKDHFNGTNFFEEFEFFSKPDPTHGFVRYVDNVTASNESLAGYSGPDGSSIYLGVDYKTPKAESPGRKSVRVQSKKTWNHGLFIADINHVPTGACGLWPAFWTVGDNWPEDGAISILEGVGQGRTNSVTLHSTFACFIGNFGIPMKNSSELLGSACSIGNSRVGCGYRTSDEMNYGALFNDLGGGQYIMEWTSEMIRVWFFTRSQIPPNWLRDLDLTLDPDLWAPPIAVFHCKRSAGGYCNLEKRFKNHRIVFNTALCGDLAGQENVWNNPGPDGPDDSCGKKAKTCAEYVSSNAEVFKKAFWEINDVRVYETETQPEPAPGESELASSPTSTPTSAPGPSGPVSSPSSTPASAPKSKRRTPGTWKA